MATATRMWSKDGLTESPTDGKLVKMEGWHIIDASTREIAKAADGLPVRNQLESATSKYRYRSVNVSRFNGPTSWMAIAELAIPDNGTFVETPEDPLLGVMRWTCERFEVGRVSEFDAYRKRKINSAGDIYPPEVAQYVRYRLTGRRYERLWNDAKNRAYDNKTNSNAMRLFTRTILPYECLCKGISPVGEFEDDPDYMLIEYAFEIGTNERVAESGPMSNISGFPFDAHYLDQGSRGWIDSTTRGRFCYVNDNGEFIDYANDVILDGTGKPKATAIKIVDFERVRTPSAPVANPNSSQHLVGGGATSAGNVQSPFSTATEPQWLYRNHVAVNFADILSLP